MTNNSGSLKPKLETKELIMREPLKNDANKDMSLISNRTILITGAAGSIGSELCRQSLQYTPSTLIMLDNNESGLYNLEIELRAQFPHQEIIATLVDITQQKDLQTLFDTYHPQIVYHTAAYKHVPMLEAYPNEAIRVNIAGTLNVARLSTLYDAERFVLVSSDKAVEPSSVMGASKRLCELLIHDIAISHAISTLFTVVRFGNVLRSRGSVVPLFQKQIDNGGPVTVTHKDMKRYFMSITESVNLIIHAATMTKGGDMFVLKMGEELSVLAIAENMIKSSGLQPYKDIDIQFIGIRPGEKLNEQLYYDFEKPITTTNPHIMRLDNLPFKDANLPFLACIEHLINRGIPVKSKAIKYLMDICKTYEP